MAAILTLLAGTFYGLIIGLIPSAGATTGLVALFGFISFFSFDPYLGVVFCMAVVAASTTGDTYAGILLGIPGANSAAATMVDGYPLAQKGEAGSEKRQVWLKLFNFYLLFAIWIIAPIVFILFLFTYIPFKWSINKDKKYYSSIELK